MVRLFQFLCKSLLLLCVQLLQRVYLFLFPAELMPQFVDFLIMVLSHSILYPFSKFVGLLPKPESRLHKVAVRLSRFGCFLL